MLVRSPLKKWNGIFAVFIFIKRSFIQVIKSR